MKRVIMSMVAVFCLLSFMSCERQRAAEGTYNWTIAMSVANTTINYIIAEKFAELINERSEGRINVQIFPGGQLGNTTEFTQSVIAGNIDFGSGITTDIVDFVPEAAVFDIPNLFPNVSVMREVLQGDFMDVMNEHNRRGGIRMLGYSDAGFRQLTSNRRVDSIGDLAGQRIRVMTNPYHLAYWQALGASAVVMEFVEVFMGLQLGTIDGQENPYMNIVGNNIHEVQNYIIETNHVGHIITFFMNNSLYESLPDDIRRLVDECAAEAIAYGNQQADISIGQFRQICIDAGVEIIILPPEELREFEARAVVVSDMVRGVVGNEIVDDLLAAIQRVQ